MSSGAIGQIIAANTVSTAFLVSTAIQSISSPNPNNFFFPKSGVYRPSGWSKPAVTSITVPPNAQQASAASANNLVANPTTYVFDGCMRVDSSDRLEVTKHPVQTQANISDHAFPVNRVLTIRIEMSDAMDSYTPGQWTGAVSKGVSVHTLLTGLQKTRTFITLNTRLAKYQNMLITDVSPTEDNSTLFGYKGVVTFTEIFVGTVTTNPSSAKPANSARPQTTQTSPTGEVQPLPVDNTITNRNGIGLNTGNGNGVGGSSGSGSSTGQSGSGSLQGGLGTSANGGTVPGSGDWSSNAGILTGTINKSATP